MIVPGWGPALLALALQRFCVALRMCVEAGLRAEKTLHYCFRATSNSAFTSREDKATGRREARRRAHRGAARRPALRSRTSSANR